MNDGFERVEKFASTHWTFEDNELLLDFSLTPFNRADIKKLISRLANKGVNIIPVVQSTSDARLINLGSELLNDDVVSKVCLRCSNLSAGFVNLNTQIDNLLRTLSVNANQSYLLLDFGYVQDHNYNAIGALAIGCIKGLDATHDFADMIIASGSFPENLAALTAGRLHRLQRFEWAVWQILLSQKNIKNKISYGDYGTKYPYYSDVNFKGSCSIKYTADTEFIIYRGELSENHPEGNGQYIIFADKLIRSADYSGIGFSWGDGRINEYAQEDLRNPGRKTGNATNWVEISQNHHITLIESIL